MAQPGWQDTDSIKKGSSGGFTTDGYDYPKRQVPFPARGSDGLSGGNTTFAQSTNHFMDDKATEVKSKETKVGDSTSSD